MKKERSLHNYKKTSIDIFCDILVKVILPCIVIGIMLLITITSHASGIENSAYFPMGQNDNNIIPNVVKEYMDYVFDSENNFILGQVYENSATYLRLNVLVFSKESNATVCGEVNNNGYKFSFYLVGTLTNGNGLNRSYYSVTFNKNTGNVSNGSPNGSFWSKTANIDSSLFNQNVAYISNFAVYTTNVEETRALILKYGSGNEEPPVIDTGHATPPEEFNTPVYPQGHSKPQTVPPTYTVNNYSWTTYTPPVVDNSTLEKLVESLTDIVKYNATYLKDNLHNEFTNLINNIKNLIDYIGQTIQYYGDLIIENIQNLITTFYNNMLSLFEPIATAIDYISQPLDMDSLTDTVNSTQIFDDVDTCTTFANDAFGIYGTVAEPNTFKIPLDLRSISLLNITQVYYIDLSWLDGAKSAIRAFMWCVVTFGLLYSVIVDIPNMIRSSK